MSEEDDEKFELVPGGWTAVYRQMNPVQKALSSIRVDDGFDYFSGHTAALHNQPTIYASMDGDKRVLTVVSRHSKKVFPVADIEDALRYYRLILKADGYVKE